MRYLALVLSTALQANSFSRASSIASSEIILSVDKVHWDTTFMTKISRRPLTHPLSPVFFYHYRWSWLEALLTLVPILILTLILIYNNISLCHAHIGLVLCILISQSPHIHLHPFTERNMQWPAKFLALINRN